MMPRLSLSRVLPVLIGTMAIVLSVKLYSIVQVLNGNEHAFGPDGLVNVARAAGMAQASPAPPAPVPAPVAEAPAAQVTQSQPASDPSSANACDRDIACKSKPGLPPALAGANSLIDDMARRQRQLDADMTALDDRKRAMAAAEAALQQRVTSITTSEAVLRQSEQHDIALSNDDANRLVRIYQAMKPADAAAIFNILDLRVSSRLLGLMDPRHASAIMGAMLPQRAILATQMLAKTHAVPTSAGHAG